ncbi:hypothetical protein Ancab_023421, partial [Ancistrocladus abbreviatus]
KLKTVSRFGQKDETTKGCTVELSEDSIHDSQICNMNNWLSLSDAQAENQGPELSPAQMWNFLTQLGVGGCVDSEMIERHIEAMGARDVCLYAKVLAEHNAECVEEANGLL